MNHDQVSRRGRRRSGHAVMELFRDLTRQEGTGALVVSHDDRLREIADQVLWLEDGRIVGVADDRLRATG